MSLPKIETKHEDIDVPGVGTLRVRPLTRGEVVELQDVSDADPFEMQLRVAVLTIDGGGDDVGAWFDALPTGIAERVFKAIVGLAADEGEIALGN